MSVKRAAVRYDISTGQNYTELTEGTAVYRMWLEDETSLKKRISVMKRYRLAGVAAWREGYEKRGTWKTIGGFLKQP
jgi:spore germination protein YaaH